MVTVYFCNYYRCPNAKKEELVNRIMKMVEERYCDEDGFVSVLNCDQNNEKEMDSLRSSERGSLRSPQYDSLQLDDCDSLLFVFGDGSKPGEVDWPITPIFIPCAFWQGCADMEKVMYYIKNNFAHCVR